MIDGTTSGWLKIISYEGEKWINQMERRSMWKNHSTRTMSIICICKRKWRQSFLAQEVPVIDGTTSGWLKIISYEGEKWINQMERKSMWKNHSIRTMSIICICKRKWRQDFSAQEVLVIDGTTSGWLEIISYEGEKWINPNASEVSGVIELALKQLGKHTSLENRGLIPLIVVVSYTMYIKIMGIVFQGIV